MPLSALLQCLLARLSGEDFRNVLNTNLIAPFLLIKKALPAMTGKRRFDFINVPMMRRLAAIQGWCPPPKFWPSEGSMGDLEVRKKAMFASIADPGNMNTAMHRAAELR